MVNNECKTLYYSASIDSLSFLTNVFTRITSVSLRGVVDLLLLLPHQEADV